MDLSDGPLAELDARFTACEAIVRYQFRDRRLLHAALTHASGAQHRLASNERLEFLGDAILGAIVCELLFHQFPGNLEGHLTKIKSVVVSRQTCAKISYELGLDRLLIVGKGISSGRPVPPSLLADVFESLVAAIYLDGGIEPTRAFVARHIQPEIDLAASGTADDNYKSLLQQIVQRDFSDTPTYDLRGERGPDHNKSFLVAASFAGQSHPPAWGRNKKEAEQRAAANALAVLMDAPIPFPILPQEDGSEPNVDAGSALEPPPSEDSESPTAELAQLNLLTDSLPLLSSANADANSPAAADADRNGIADSDTGVC